MPSLAPQRMVYYGAVGALPDGDFDARRQHHACRGQGARTEVSLCRRIGRISNTFRYIRRASAGYKTGHQIACTRQKRRRSWLNGKNEPQHVGEGRRRAVRRTSLLNRCGGKQQNAPLLKRLQRKDRVRQWVALIGLCPSVRWIVSAISSPPIVRRLPIPRRSVRARSGRAGDRRQLAPFAIETSSWHRDPGNSLATPAGRFHRRPGPVRSISSRGSVFQQVGTQVRSLGIRANICGTLKRR
jgi:hypothetical protein